MTDLRCAALEYGAIDWHVFPLVPRGKVPAIPSVHPKGDPARGVCKGECGREGHGLHDATTDSETIGRWWRRWPNANIGLRTGVAFDVLDVDGAAGQVELMSHMPAEEMPLGYGPWSLTPGKNDEDGNHLGSGDHVLYLPTGRGNRAGFLPHLDWRGDGGYIVAPPSIHPDGHGAYEWGYGPEYALEPAPEWLLELVWPPTLARSPGAGGPMPSSSAYGERALEGEIGRLALLRGSSGTRNHQLNASAYNLAQLVAGGVLSARVVVDALLQTALSIGLDQDEAEATIESGMRAGLASPRRMPA